MPRKKDTTNHFIRVLTRWSMTVCLFIALPAQSQEKRDEILETMKNATRYMMDKASCNGGFVWTYLPDFSRSWGEMEAKRTMVWIQSPGTPLVGQLLLDAYHATGDEYYYEQAKRVANVLIWGQEPCGGWNYMFDMAGENSLKEWYATIGRNGWRMEEFQHYYGNATFDDSVTSDAAQFLLRIYVEKYDPTFLPALDKAIGFILESQYPTGGWPQRYPLKYDHVFQDKADYSSFITLNDDVISDNIDFLARCYQTLGRKNLKESILRALNLMIALQQGEPYAGWADQYTAEDLQPAHARSYEPRSINTGTTVRMIYKMCDYYKLTGETKFLSGIPAAIRFLESVRLPDSEVARFGRRPLQAGEILVPRFIDPDSGKPLYVHRKGSNVWNGTYYTNQDISHTIVHYSSAVTVAISRIRDDYEQVKALPREEAVKDSPLSTSRLTPLPSYYVTFLPERKKNPYKEEGQETNLEQCVRQIRDSLTEEGYWLTPLTSCSNPYKPCPENKRIPNDDTHYRETFVGDEYDTSCYPAPGNVQGISTKTYVSNMSKLIQYITTHEK